LDARAPAWTVLDDRASVHELRRSPSGRAEGVFKMGDRWGTSRLEAFSDGIFAIAATLLVLEIGVPEAQVDDLWRGIADQWPSYLAYATSFLTIGSLWLAHHAIVRRLAFADAGVMRINLGLLMVVAFLPFPTRLVAEAIESSDSERAAALFYGGCLLAISLLINAMWRYALKHRALLEPGVTEAEAQAILRASTPNLVFYAIILVLAGFAPRAAAIGFLVIAVVAVLRARGEGPRRPARAAAT
jgi:uncharacterized membrane protein